LDEVEAGGIYELVITTLHGGPLARYRTGDMIKIESLRNEKLDIDIPQMTFHRRADDVIFLGNIFRLTETVIWRAIEKADIGYVDWVANKEVYEGNPILRVYMELKGNTKPDVEKMERDIYEEIKKLDDGFIHNIKDIGSMEKLMNLYPVRVTLLPVGAFSNYSRQKQASGADLAQLKPPRINPSAEVIALLLSDITEHKSLETVYKN
ncbi:MAG: GH3 auxin-responsive promoter family protein, partial [Fibrobacter sp.]|nr:GH3 auxin-responsive promoter family protein [Fibrobacter sp.]